MSSLTVTLVQPDLVWEDKPANLAMLEKMIMGIAEKTELVVLPEMFSTGFSMNAEKLAETMDGEGVQWMKRIAAQKKCILTGSLIIREEKDGAAGCFNRLIWMLPDGQFGFYDKRHLFGFAGEDKHYRPGLKKLMGSVKGWKINLKVCYDLRFPVWLRQDPASAETGPEYDMLVVVANWPSSRVLAWDTLLRARAIENQCYVVAVNRTGTDGNGLPHPGHSVVYGPLGEPLLVCDDKPGTFTLTLSRELLEETRKKFPFWRDADHFFIQS